MDELCKLLADKLGIVADASASWLQTAVPQYAEMMAIRTTFLAALSVAAFLFFMVSLGLAWRKVDDSDVLAITCIACVFMILMFGCIAVVFTPDAICWHVTPDAMLLRELVGAVK